MKLLRSVFPTLFFLFILSPSIQAQFANFEDTWKEFLGNDKTSNISKLTKPPKDQVIDYAKYCLMYANTHFCSDEIDDAEEMMAEIRTIGEGSYKQIPGFTPKFDDLDVKIEAYHKVDKLWKRFQLGKSIGLEDLEVEYADKVCEKGTLAKFSYMLSYAHYCEGNMKEARNKFEKRVLKLVEHTTLKLTDVSGLEKGVEKTKKLYAGLTALDKAWKEYMETGESPGFDVELPLVKCNTTPSIKAYLLKATFALCDEGPEMLKKIQNLRKKHPQDLDKKLEEKIEWLEEEVGKNTGDVAVLQKAWEEFVPSDTLMGSVDFGYEYCRVEDRLRAYVMEGMADICGKAEENLQTIAGILKEEEPELEEITEEKIKALVSKYQEQGEKVSALEEVWATFIENEDTLTADYYLESFYCDEIALVKSWVIKGHMEACANGQAYIDRIDQLQKTEKLEFDEELDCRVLRLRGKVYQCRYIELVIQARKETHQERERFGPSSAGIMQQDLNSDKQPCETKVQYAPLGNIGIQYIISTFLCQDVDLAKMGDPEYYKKIATWVDTEVLQKYCEASMRCKEDFYIYLEGHTDGHPFKGARYKKSLEIPEGTAFTHYTGEEAVDTTATEREITTSLRSNMELGIARAWTVKNQLDFMGVPITIGAYEHPKTEKGGEYRKVDIELNITNLLLDFYEKRLQDLIEESGIGERPEECE